MKRLYSFDIFDTCLVRSCRNSTNVFHILANTILGNNCETSQKEDFVLTRINGEKKARNTLINHENEEVTLEEIYDFCDFSLLTKVDKLTILRKEIEVEKEVLLPGKP